MREAIFVVGIFTLMLSVLLTIQSRRRTKRTLDLIEEMLTEARRGSFHADRYDESRLSKVASQLSDYLSSSAIAAKQVAEEKNRLASLVTDISHQTKTPIANLLLYSEMLEDAALPKEQMENVNAIRAQAKKLRFLIDDLVKLSRLESGIISLHRQKTPVLPLLAAVREQLKEKVEKKGIALLLCPKEEPASAEETDPSLLMAEVDPKWTQEALFNIVDNAVKYTSVGSVTLDASAYELFVRIDVTDTGIGIPEEEQAKVFGRFYRAPYAAATEGVGIGLYLAREILSGEGGYIKVRSDGVHGTTFSVFLPR